ncbi:HNH endonuclease signature motif containing protein [Leucobacter chromiireducens]|uniref:HNH endonuclease n=1 Tax=Leucobacter chromiireducens subsp. solipictus TaxID=398235 RepID=A0ABS1SGC9_9MICO|nr:HNH endonuclease signature motif containing protein [Leucobacter chromiireducens]MBL3679097.1 HNH endonuclease [Leucobacter chromiireducens subsp. solipictus]
MSPTQPSDSEQHRESAQRIEEIAALDAVVTGLEAVERQRRALDGERVRLLSAALGLAVTGQRSGNADLRYRALRAELATALNCTEAAIEAELSVAERLVERFPATLRQLGAGDIAYAHARVLADASAPLGHGTDGESTRRRRAYETEVLAEARTETPNRLRPIAQRIALRCAELPPEDRHREAARCRSVRVVDQADGMSDLIAHLPSLEAHAVKDRLTRIARHTMTARSRASSEANDPPAPDSSANSAATAEPPPQGTAGLTIDAVRADALADLLLSREPTTLFAGDPAEAVRGHVQLVVSIDADPAAPGPRITEAELVGCGPLDPASASEVFARTPVWERVHGDPQTGTVLEVDRYRPSAKMRRFLGARDLHCRFPGCRAPLSRTDIDHTTPAARGGPTATTNLAHLCRSHHTIKGETDWGVSQDATGTLTWRSPTGRTHVDRPPSRVRFRQVPPEPPEPPGPAGPAEPTEPPKSPAPPEPPAPF